MGRFVDQFFTQITGPSLTTDGGPTPKLVLLHGVMGYAANWRRVAKTFESQFQVLAYDSRGHGRSVHADLDKTPDAYTPESLAEDLHMILDDLGWEKIHLIGHSMGGRVAYTFAAAYPDCVKSLVIEDIGPNMSALNSSTVTRILDSVPVPFKDKREAKSWFDQQFPILFRDLNNASVLGAWLYANITEEENPPAKGVSRRAVWRFDVDGIRAAVVSGRTVERWDTIRAIRAPTLVVRGEFSKDLPRDIFDQMLKENTLFEGVEIKGAGHWVHSEQTEAFNHAVASFLSERAGIKSADAQQ